MSFKVTRADPKGTVSKTDIAAGDVTYIDGSFSLSNVNANATVSFTALSSSLTYVNAAFTLEYQRIIPASVTLGNYLLREILTDEFFVAEFSVISTGKNFFELVTAAEDIVAFGVTKALADAFSVAEQIDVGLRKVAGPDFAYVSESIDYLSINKNQSDNLLWTDTLQLDSSKILVDQSDIEDAIAKGFTRSLTDQLSHSDSYTIASNKVFIESLFFGDSTTLVSNKEISDGANLTDLGIAYSLSYHVTDAISATDDFLGEANLDDDQTIHFNKNTTNLVGTTDSLSRQVLFARDFSDAAYNIDVVSLSNFKYVADASLAVDVIAYNLNYSRLFSDTLSINDSASIGFSRLQQDNGVINDIDVKSIGKVDSDLVNITDTGALFWQDYVDNLYYFAGDYVGDRQLF